MIYTPRKMPRWLFILNWAVISGLTASTIIDSIMFGGWRMALNGFALGIVTVSMLINPLMNRMWKAANEAHDELELMGNVAKQMTAQLQQALNEGRIEVVPISPDTDFPTRH